MGAQNTAVNNTRFQDSDLRIQINHRQVEREEHFMMEYIIPVHLSYEDSKGLFKGKSKFIRSNTGIFTQRKKPNTISLEIRRGSHQIIAILQNL